MGEAGIRSATADEVNDFDDVTGGDLVHGVPSARHDGAIDLDRDRSVLESEVLDQRANGQPLGHVA